MSNSIVLQLGPRRNNSRNSEGSFVTLAGGRILFGYTKFQESNHDDGHAVIVTRHSDDGGRTWSGKDQLLVPRADAQNVMSVSLLRLQDGRIALHYLRKETGNCMPFIRFSEDEAKTFSEPLPLIASGGYYVVNNDRLVQLRSGRLIVPVAYHRMRGAASPSGTSFPAPQMAAGALVCFLLSDDGGHHWYESANGCYAAFPTGGGLQEPGVVELKNGTLWGWARAASDGVPARAFQWLTHSKDAGLTWSAAKPGPFVSPPSPMSAKRIPSTGDLLAVWNDRSGRFPPASPDASSWGRTPLVTAISADEGRTWAHHRSIEDGPGDGYCYTAIHFVDDSVLLAYCAGGASSRMVLDTLRVRRMSVVELYEG